MSQPVITVEGLGKRYTLHHQARAGLLRDRLAGLLRNPFRREKAGQASDEEFWALRDVNFAVNQGDVVGIIGRNGAGKSTLLKILSRITEPTTGRIKIHGRIASLLEVGTGFHGELSGRENIFLNGAILGMKRAEIRAKFAEIVAFAEVEKFLDTPVKHYSSGMYVRLAFAVAAHLEPEILIVDEVLAVGDAAFQKKCLGKMQSVSRDEGRTVLFVSHNLATVQSLCTRSIVLRTGNVAVDGPTSHAIAHYLSIGLPGANLNEFQGNDPALSIQRAFYEPAGENSFIEVELTIRCKSPKRVGVEFILTTASGLPAAFAEHGSLAPSLSLSLDAGEHRMSWRLDVASLANGTYLLAIQLVEPGVSVLLRHEYPLVFELCRPPTAPATRVLEQAWQAGCVNIGLSRL
jgi:lipopolysaccharide transport system ATP-binding protein